MKLNLILSTLVLLLLLGCSSQVKEVKVLQVPGKDQFCVIDRDGVTVLPSGRYVTMAGDVIPITNDPYGHSKSAEL